MIKLSLILILVVILFFPSLSSYFMQDDFFHLKMSRVENWRDVLAFFSFRNPYGYSFYRPLTTQVYLWIVRSVFGLNPLFFHLIGWIFYFGLIFLVFRLINMITKREKVALLAAFLYAINASQLGNLYYISNFQELGVAAFSFLAVIFFLKQKDRTSLLFFALALLSKETAIMVPLLLFTCQALFKRVSRRLLPFFLILILYFVLHFQSGFIPTTGVYSPVFSPKKILNTFGWYFLWALGTPEMLVDFVGPRLALNPRFLQLFPLFAVIIFTCLAILLAYFLLAGFYLLFKKREFFGDKAIWFFVAWFLITISPVLLWPQHKFSFYLTTPLLGFSAVVSLVVLEIKGSLERGITGGIVFLLFLLSFTTIKLSKRTYWVITRAKIAKNLVNQVKDKYPRLSPGAVVYFKNDPHYPVIAKEWGGSSRQAYFVLSGPNALQVIYDDYSLEVYYEDLGVPPENVPQENIFPITAVISQE